MKPIDTLGFIGLGVMGEPMCGNLLGKSGRAVYGTDIKRAPVERLAARGLKACANIAEVAAGADVIFLSLPSGREVEEVCLGAGGIAASGGRVHTVVDMSTSPPKLMRELGEKLVARGLTFLDAPVARTRQAAHDGTLSIMVGGPADACQALRPYLSCMGNEVTHCGGHGAGQVVKILNNMVLFMTGQALAEALTIARRAGVDGKLLFEVMSKGSSDSFALRNHGLKAMVPGVFPADAFPVDYAIKDISLALDLAAQAGVEAKGAHTAHALLEATSRAGFKSEYWPVVVKMVEGNNAS
ncbi:MAG: NAD(P)-dependent oxidoreductase [Hyphomicrobiales bacterium]|nr:NAD(P)-dependent oxidoreductase [Hyphomicrobiales bacterium]